MCLPKIIKQAAKTDAKHEPLSWCTVQKHTGAIATPNSAQNCTKTNNSSSDYIHANWSKQFAQPNLFHSGNAKFCCGFFYI